MKFWRNNKRDNEYEKSVADVASEFWRSRYADLAFDAWPLERCIRAFVTDAEDGLSSAFDEKDFFEMYAACREAWPDDWEERLKKSQKRLR
jgi:hypothetical protein